MSNFGCCAEEMRKFENVPDNFVYYIIVSDDHYILKLYRNTERPDDNKVRFVNQLLIQNNNIPCAELIAYSRNHQISPTSYLCCLPRKIQKIDKQNAKNKPPKKRKSAAYLLNWRLYKAKSQSWHLYLSGNQRQNPRIVKKYFLFCEYCTISAIRQKMQNMSYNIDRPSIPEALVSWSFSY